MTVTQSALSIGPAASRALSLPDAAVSVHSLFPSVLNLAVESCPFIVALMGPRGIIYPHAVALDHAVASFDFAVGDRCSFSAETIRLEGGCGELRVTLAQASRPSPRILPLIARPADAWRASVRRLKDFQSRTSCDLRISGLLGGAGPLPPLQAALQRSAHDVGDAALAVTALEAELFQATASLVGMGAGLTPSGDDFLCGFMAASRSAADPVLVSALGKAIEANLAGTGEISASQLRCALGGYWPGPLCDLADALSEEKEPAALRALDELCGLGHSSGADIASGFLFGLAIMSKRRGSLS